MQYSLLEWLASPATYVCLRQHYVMGHHDAASSNNAAEINVVIVINDRANGRNDVGHQPTFFTDDQCHYVW